VFTASGFALVGFSNGGMSASGATVIAPPCYASAVRVTEHNAVVGAGHVNDLFWIRNISDRACSIRGYPRVEYVDSKGTSLSVASSDSPGNDGNFVGGLKRGLAVPPSILVARGGLASFWVDGLDIQAGSPPPACIHTTRMFVLLPRIMTLTRVITPRGNGYFWCGGVLVLPVLPGNSGSDPSRPLSYYFGTPNS
jgi:hypothetical protein